MDSKKDNITPARVIGLWEEDLRNLTRLQHAWNHIRNFCIVLEVCEVIRFFAMPGYYWICWTTRIKGRPRSDGECAETPLSMGHFRIASSLHFKTRLHRSFFYMTSLYPFLVYKTMEWRTELSLVPSNLHGH